MFRAVDTRYSNWKVKAEAGWCLVDLAAAHPGPDGIGLTATVVENGDRGQDSIPQVALERIGGTTLVFHPKSDGCYVTTWSGAKRLAKKSTAAPKVETNGATGGDPGKESGRLSHHGFPGMREQVIEQIADWIKSH